MSNNAAERQTGFYRGVRACIAWLHSRADTMNDPHARAVLNSAAFSLGVEKPATVHQASKGGAEAIADCEASQKPKAEREEEDE